MLKKEQNKINFKFDSKTYTNSMFISRTIIWQKKIDIKNFKVKVNKRPICKYGRLILKNNDDNIIKNFITKKNKPMNISSVRILHTNFLLNMSTFGIIPINNNSEFLG